MQKTPHFHDMRISSPIIRALKFVRSFLSVFSFCAGASLSLSYAHPSDLESLRSKLLFHASFDNSTTADYSQGEPKLFEASTVEERASAKAYSPDSKTASLQPSGGRFGGCLKFEEPLKSIVFYKVDQNFPSPSKFGEGTVSFWLKTDPESELREGFCDPIQITSKQWDDAAFFVEFEKRANHVPFRLGVYSDRSVWNPDGKEFASIPPENRPLASVSKPPFQKGKWVHVAFSFANFNNNQSTGTASLYLEGALVATLAPRRQVFTWDMDKAALMLGLNYVGSMDDLAIFNRALTAEEIQALYALPNGARDLNLISNH